MFKKSYNNKQSNELIIKYLIEKGGARRPPLRFSFIRCVSNSIPWYRLYPGRVCFHGRHKLFFSHRWLDVFIYQPYRQ